MGNNKQINIKCKVSEHPGQRRRSSKGPEEARPKPPATPSSFIIVGHHGITTGKSNSARRSSSPRRPLPNGAIPKSPRSRNTHKSLHHSPSQPGSFRDVHEFPQGRLVERSGAPLQQGHIYVFRIERRTKGFQSGRGAEERLRSP